MTAGTALPAGWTGADIGNRRRQARRATTTGTFTVDGAGVDIWGTTDQFQYVYQQVTGDIDIIARVVSLENDGRVVEGRRDDPGSADGRMRRTPRWSSRPATGPTLDRAAGDRRRDEWHASGRRRARRSGSGCERRGTVGDGVPVERRDDVDVGGHDDDGAATIYVGLAVTSHDAGDGRRDVFDNVVVQDAGPPISRRPRR